MTKARKNFKFPMDWSDDEKALAYLRQAVAAGEKMMDQKDPDVEEETLHVPARDGYSLELRVFRKASPTDDSGTEQDPPVIVLYFGGGFCIGSPAQMSSLARPLVKRFKAVVVAPSYRLAPEYPFPTGIQDGWDSISWIAENAKTTLRAD